MNMSNISLFHLFLLQIKSILESGHMTGHIHFWPHKPLNFPRPFNLHEFVPACKKISLLHLFILQMESILASHHMPGHIHLLTTPTAKIFNVFSTCMNLYQKAVKSWDTVNFRVQIPDLLNLLCELVNLEIIQFDWLRVFWPTSQERDFSQT